MNKDVGKGIKSRALTIRIRTFTLTLALLVAIAFYFVVTITTKQKMNVFDFLFLASIQLITYSLYFPDGDIYGQKDNKFKRNKLVYNIKADHINTQKQIGKLREYCDIDFMERKERYIVNMLGIIGITLDEFEYLKTFTEEDIKHLKEFTINSYGEDKKIIISKHKRKIIYSLLFKPLPVEKNYTETIMSAIENDGNKAIKDESLGYKKFAYGRKIFMAVIVGAIFAYISYTVKDSFKMEYIISIFMYLTAIFTTAVMAFTAGETCSKVHKSNFYMNLSNFIDNFFEWANIEPPLITNIEDESI